MSTMSATTFSDLDRPAVRRIDRGDVVQALKAGIADFTAMPSHVVFLGLVYVVFGLVLGTISFSSSGPALIFPLVSGFALIGPLAAIGLYELSRRREAGLSTRLSDVMALRHSPALPALTGLTIILLVMLVLWLLTAQSIFRFAYGALEAPTLTALLYDAVTTPRGWLLIALGHAAGFVFAAVVFSISVVSFPMVLDRGGGGADAIATSIRAVRTNPGPMAFWAAIIAALLMVGSAPLLIGLAVIFPVLGHASWHLYRRLVELPLPGQQKGQIRPLP